MPLPYSRPRATHARVASVARSPARRLKNYRVGALDGDVRTQHEVCEKLDWARLGGYSCFLVLSVLPTADQLSGTSGFMVFASVLHECDLVAPLLYPPPYALARRLIVWCCGPAPCQPGYFFIYRRSFPKASSSSVRVDISEAGEYAPHISPGDRAGVHCHTAGLFSYGRAYAGVSARGRRCSHNGDPGGVIGYRWSADRRSDTMDDAIDRFESRIEPAVPWQMIVAYRRYTSRRTHAGMSTGRRSRP